MTDPNAPEMVYDPKRDMWCHLPSGACSAATGARPKLPTYATIADVLEGKNGSGIRLLGWTIGRAFMIAPCLRIAGIPWKKAFLGAAVASLAISGLTLVRIAKAEYEVNQAFLSNRKWLKKKWTAPQAALPAGT